MAGLAAVLPGVSFTGRRVTDAALSDAEPSAYDTLALLGLCRLELPDAAERAAVRGFVEGGGKLVLRDRDDAPACPSDNRDYTLPRSARVAQRRSWDRDL